MAQSPKDPGEGGAAPPPKRRRRASRSAAKSAQSDAPAATAPETAPETPTPVLAPSEEPGPTEPAPPPADTSAPPPGGATASSGGGRTRGIAAWVITVLAAIAVSASVVAFWVHESVLDTDRFMAAVTPAVESEAVQAVIADRVSDELIEALDLESRIGAAVTAAGDGISEALGDALGLTPTQVERLDRLDIGLQRLAAPIAAGVETRIRGAVDQFVTSVAGSDRLLEVVAAAHERAVHLVRNELEDLPNVVVEEGEVRLNLVPILAEALRSVVNQGIGAIGIERQIPPFDSNEDAERAITRLADVLGRDLPSDFGQVKLMTEDQLQNAQDLVRTFDRLVWLLLILAVVLAVLAVILAPTRRSGLIRVGVGVAIAVVLGWVAVDLISARLADAAGTAEGATAIAELTSTVVATMQPVTAALAIIGLGAAAAAFISLRGGWNTNPTAVEGE